MSGRWCGLHCVPAATGGALCLLSMTALNCNQLSSSRFDSKLNASITREQSKLGLGPLFWYSLHLQGRHKLVGKKWHYRAKLSGQSSYQEHSGIPPLSFSPSGDGQNTAINHPNKKTKKKNESKLRARYTGNTDVCRLKREKESHHNGG